MIEQENEGWTRLFDGSLRIDQTLVVPRESVKVRICIRLARLAFGSHTMV